MALDSVQHFLKQYDEVAKAAVTVVGTLSGWVYHVWRRRREARPQFTLEAKGEEIILGNHGKEAFEIIHASIVLRDVQSRPELAKKHTMVVGVATTVRPGGNAVIGKLDGPVENAVREIWAPYRRNMEAMGFVPAVDADMAHMDYYLTCRSVTSNRVHSVRFERWVSHVPGVGWGIGYGPHQAIRMAPWYSRLARRVRRIRPMLTHPAYGWAQWKKRRWLQRHLDVIAVLRAAGEGTITKSEAERRLQKMARRARMSLDAFIKEYTPVGSPNGSGDGAEKVAAQQAVAPDDPAAGAS